ncbi:MAG: ATP-binding cassette domain-containing protein [Erysipelotrichaceae bacterium]
MIKFENVSKQFKNQEKIIKAVDNLSLEIEEGQIFGIIGSSGAGKSTLVRLINKLEVVDSGKVFVDGADVMQLSNNELLKMRQNIGMIFQHFNLLWSKNVYENIALPLKIAHKDKAYIDQRVKELIELVGLQGKEKSYPSKLSGGQKQKVGIARALANNPKILLCDEAISALDPQTTSDILDLIKKINEKYGITIVMITHQMEVVLKVSHKIAIISDGKIIECGDTKDIFANPTHPITKSLVTKSDYNDEVEDVNDILIKQCPNGHILRLYFTPSISHKPIIQEVFSKVKGSMSIVHANIKNTADGSRGIMYVHVFDIEDNQYQNLIDLLNEENVKVEVIK